MSTAGAAIVAEPSAAARTDSSPAKLVGKGAWLVENAALLDLEVDQATTALARGSGPVVLAMDALTRLDTAGAWLLYRSRRRLEAAGRKVSVEGLDGASTVLLERVESACFKRDLPPPPKPQWLADELAKLGCAVLDALDEIQQLLAFFGALVTTLASTIVRPWRLRFTSFSAHLLTTGLDALPIVGLLSFLIGVVLAFQGASQLRQFGAEIFTINLLSISILREIGVLMTAIIVAGRSGSAFTAQIGTMVVNEEVDAMRTLGLDPMEVLVLPRVLALMVALPLLAVFADVMGLLGGGLLTIFILDIPVPQFLSQLRASTDGSQFWLGIIKAPVFAFVIAMVGCRNGLMVGGDAESVGRLTTQAVVSGIFLVIILDAAFSIAYNALGY